MLLLPVDAAVGSDPLLRLRSFDAAPAAAGTVDCGTVLGDTAADDGRADLYGMAREKACQRGRRPPHAERRRRRLRRRPHRAAGPGRLRHPARPMSAEPTPAAPTADAAEPGRGGRDRAPGRHGQGQQVLRRPPRAQRHRPHRRQGRGAGRHRAVGVGQVDAVPHDQPARAHRLRLDHHRRGGAAGGGQGPGQAPGRRGHGLPVVQPVRPQDGPAERHHRPDQGPQDVEGAMPARRRSSCWSGSGSPTRPTGTRPSCREASSSGRPSPGPWPWIPSSCSSTSRRRPSTPR